jgi:poly(A) polymerase
MPPKAGEPPSLPVEAAKLLSRAAAAHEDRLYLVGGAVRDYVLGRPVQDLDLATVGAKPLARKLASVLKATLVVLDEENAVYRLVLPPGRGEVRQLDLAEIQGPDIETDLARRDFTVNAVAAPVSTDKGRGLETLIDPRGGLADLRRKVLRAESEELFKSDPLRLLRAFRIAAQLDFEIEAQTLSHINRLRNRVRQPAAERIQSELMLMLAVAGCSRRLNEMDECALLTALFPELEPTRQCALVYYGPGGVMKHSLDTAARADFLLNHLAQVFPDWSGRLEKAISSRSVLILAALLHDVSKPESAKQVDGRLRFFGHDTAGAKRAGEMLKKLKFPRAHIDTVCAAIANHLRPGNLAASGVVTDKAAYRFFRDLGEHALPLLLVCWADHASYLAEDRVIDLLKTARAEPGEGLSRLKPEEARKTVLHLQVVTHLLRRLLEEPEKAAPEPILDGHAVMDLLGLTPGPEVGKYLERLCEAQATGAVATPAQAAAFLRKTKK